MNMKDKCHIKKIDHNHNHWNNISKKEYRYFYSNKDRSNKVHIFLN